MPDRYVQDTAKHCTLVTQTQMVAKWVDDRPRWWDWLVPRGDVHDPVINTDLGSVSWTYFGDGAQVLFPYSVVPAIPHTLGFTIQDFRDVPFRVSTVETINSLTIDHVGDYSLDFVPHGGTVNVVWTKAVSSPPTVTLTVLGLHLGHWTYEPGEVYVQLCNSRDPYEFGFNGKYKDNEIAGTGNSMDFGARMYDSRLARFRSLDPDKSKYPFQSPYVYANNTPIQAEDHEGKGAGYAALKLLAQGTKSGIAVSVSGGVSFGVGVSAAAGMGVDRYGNFALFYSTSLPSMDQNTFKAAMSRSGESNLSLGANFNVGASILPGKDISAITGNGFSLSVGGYAPTGEGGGGSIDFAIASNGKTTFNGISLYAGVGTPGKSVGTAGLTQTYATLYSEKDYHTLYDTPWDKKGVSNAMEWTKTVKDGDLGNPKGFWSYDGAQEIYEPVPGQKGAYSVSILQSYHFNTTSRGAEAGMKDVSITKTTPTGITMRQVDQYTLQSDSYKKPQ